MQIEGYIRLASTTAVIAFIIDICSEVLFYLFELCFLLVHAPLSSIADWLFG